MLKIGVLGAGHLGKIHIRLVKELSDVFELVGFYDIDPEVGKAVAAEFEIDYYVSAEALIDAVDCVDIVTPTLSHYQLAAEAVRRSKHIFVEKPITETVAEAESLLNLVNEAGVKAQVGHVERFNPAFKQAVRHLHNPMFIESHRLSQFNPRGTDVPVVLDLMIHDIDAILSVVKSDVRRVSASGVAVVSDTPDIANARVEFDNGCVANLTASRISLKNMRKSRFFQKDAYISVDFLEKELEIVQMEDVQGEPDPFDMVLEMGEGKPAKKILFDKPALEPTNAIKEELFVFAQSIINNTSNIVTLEDGVNALKLAHMILEKLKLNGHLMEKQ
jgi:predicted dehydrogenase